MKAADPKLFLRSITKADPLARFSRWLGWYFLRLVGESRDSIRQMKEYDRQLSVVAAQLRPDEVENLPDLSASRMHEVLIGSGLDLDTIRQHLCGIAAMREFIKKFQSRSGSVGT